MGGEAGDPAAQHVHGKRQGVVLVGDQVVIRIGPHPREIAIRVQKHTRLLVGAAGKDQEFRIESSSRESAPVPERRPGTGRDRLGQPVEQKLECLHAA